MDDGDLATWRYWTYDELKMFLIDNGLAIAEGFGDDNEVAMTRRGLELWLVLEAMRRLERKVT